MSVTEEADTSPDPDRSQEKSKKTKHHRRFRAGAYRRLMLTGLWRTIVRRPAFWLSVLAVLIGFASGGAAVLFRLAVDEVQHLLYGADERLLYSAMSALPWWHLLLAPIIGGLLIGILRRLLLPERRILGIADIIQASSLHGARISLRNGLGSALNSVVALGAGGSTGREGPTVHLAAAMSSWLARKLHVTETMTRTLVGCGVAAGVAASFNAPIAGVFFALEVVIGHYALSAFAPIVIAGVVGTVLSRVIIGDYPAFIMPELTTPAPIDYPLFVVLGLICALVSLAQLVAIKRCNNIFNGLDVPHLVKPAIAGVALGLIAIVLPEVSGIGYEATDLALRGDVFPLALLVIMVFGKVLATALTLGSGYAAGIFAPALFVGAMIGTAFGAGLNALPVSLASDIGLYGVVGMGAVAAPILGAPISTILIIFEMTGDYSVTTAVMIGVAVSCLVAQSGFSREFANGFFAWQLRQRGVNINAGREDGIIRNTNVGRVMRREFSTIGPEASYSEVMDKLREAVWGELFVVDNQRRLIGVITIPDLNAAALATSVDVNTLVAGELCRRSPATLAANDPLDLAMETMESARESHLPVVDSMEHHVVVGFLHEHDVMTAYYQALLQARAEERGQRYEHSGHTHV